MLETEIPGRLQVRRTIKFWGCSDGIPPLSSIQKSWTTFPALHRLHEQPQRTNGLEDKEICALVKLLKTELDSTTVGRNKIPKLR
jgi:hypothetical protein